MERNERKMIFTKEEGKELWHVVMPFGWTDDKTAHVCAAVAIALFVFAVCGCRPFAVPLGIVAAIMVGFIKECIDKYIRKTAWEWGDIAADIMGAFGGGLLSTIAYIINH